MKLVVAAEGCELSQTDGIGEENLSTSISPHLEKTEMIKYILTRPTHHRTDANLYPLERQLTKASLTLKEGPKVKSNNIRRFAAHDFL